MSDRYLIAYLCNNKYIEDFIILENFFHQIADIALKVKNINILQIRLQLYIDSLSINYHKDSKIKFIEDLKLIIEKYSLSKTDFIKIIEERNKMLDTFPFKSMEDLIRHCQNTESILWLTFAKILKTQDIDNLNSIRNASCAFAMIGNIRNYLYLSTKGVHNILYYQEELDSNLKENITTNIKDIITKSLEFINFSKQNNNIDKYTKRILLINFLTKGYIENIIKANYDIYKIDNMFIKKKQYLKLLFFYLFR